MILALWASPIAAGSHLKSGADMFSIFQTLLAIIFIPTCIFYLFMDKKPVDKLVIGASIGAHVLATAGAVFLPPPWAMIFILGVESFLAWIVQHSSFARADEYSILICISAVVSLIAVLDYTLIGGALFWIDGTDGKEPLVYFAINMVLSVIQLGILGGAAFIGRNRRTRHLRRTSYFHSADYPHRVLPDRRS